MLDATVVAAALAAASVALLMGVPRSSVLRLDAVRPPGSLRRGGVPALPATRPGLPGWCAGGAVAAAVVWAAGPIAAVLALAGTVLLKRHRAERRRVLARQQERRRAIEACTALAGELRAGRSPGQALAVAAELACGPSREALRAAAAAARLGGDVGSSLRASASVAAGSSRSLGGRGSAGGLGGGPARPRGAAPQTAVPEVLRALAACWTVCATSGSGLAAAVDRLDEGLRADQARRRAVAAELAGPRATAGMLAVLPLAGLLLAAGLGADPLGILLHTPLGWACLAGGLTFDALGVVWTGRLVDRAGGRT